MLKLAIIGAGKIATTMINEIKKESAKVEVIAIASNKMADATSFAKEHKIKYCYDDNNELLSNPEVDAVYMAMPHRYHAEWAIKAANKKKHILVEKPLAINHKEAIEVIKAAKENKVLLMEAFKFKLWEQTDKIVDVVKSGSLGKISTISSEFTYNNPTSPRKNNFLNGGGSILDVGCYTTSFVRYIAGISMGRPFADPLRSKGIAVFASNGVDLYADAILHFDQDIIGRCSCGMAFNSENRAVIYGSNGYLVIEDPWHPDLAKPASIMRLKLDNRDEEIITTAHGKGLFAYEVDYFAEQIEQGVTESPLLSYNDSLGNMQSLDLWRHKVGLSYPFE